MWSWMLWGSRLHFRSSELYQCLTSLVTRGKVKRRIPAVHVFFVGKAWTVRGMLLQVTFFPGKCSISKAVRLFHCHVWLILLICSTSPSLRPQWLHTQLTQTQTQSETYMQQHLGNLPPTQWPPFLLYSWYSLSHGHTGTLTEPWQLILWPLPRV